MPILPQQHVSFLCSQRLSSFGKSNNTNKQKSKKEGERTREGFWERWYWPITVRRFCTGISEWKRWETVVTVVICGPWGWHRLLLFHLPSLPPLHPTFSTPLTHHPGQRDPAPAKPEGSPAWPRHPPRVTLLQQALFFPFLLSPGRSAFEGTLPSFQQGKKSQIQAHPTECPWKSTNKTHSQCNSKGNNQSPESSTLLGGLQGAQAIRVSNW